MPKVQLDATFVSNAQCLPGRSKTDYYSIDRPGFVLEVRCSGGKTYYARVKDKYRRQRQYKIGRAEDVSFTDAKRAAQRIFSEVVMGGDPGAKKAEAKTTPLYADIAAQHIAYAKLHLRAHDSVEMIQRVHLLPEFGKMRVTDITRVAVAQFLAKKRAAGLAPASVLKIQIMLGRAYYLAAQADIPSCDKNPTKGLPRVRLQNSRNRYLTAEEFSRLRAAVEDSQNPQLQHVVGLLHLTGARLRELLDARWENVDLAGRTLFVPDSKSGKSRYIPLSAPALAIIAKLPRFQGCPWVLPNLETRKPLVSIKSGWKRAIRVANLPGLRIHDLRHSFASAMANNGVDLYTIGKILGHANVSSSARYSHLSASTLLAAVEAGAATQAT